GVNCGLMLSVRRRAAESDGTNADVTERETQRCVVGAGRKASRGGPVCCGHSGAIAGQFAALEIHLREAVSVFGGSCAGVAFEQTSEERDVVITDLRTD